MGIIVTKQITDLKRWSVNRNVLLYINAHKSTNLYKEVYQWCRLIGFDIKLLK